MTAAQRPRHLLLVCMLGLSASALTGCATLKVQAPYDAFVCYNTTFNKCAAKAQAGQLRTLQQGTARSFVTPGSVVLQDPDAGKVMPTADQKYRCELGTIPYNPTLKPDDTAVAVFVSPVLLRQIVEQVIRLTRARINCGRLLENYAFQQHILTLQDALAIQQKGAETLGSEVDEDRNNRQQAGGRPLTAGEMQEFKLSAGHIALGERLNRQAAVRIAEQVRNDLKAQVLDVDLKRQFEDANVTIDLQLRELARSLFILDRAVFNSSITYRPKDFEDVSWVKQGTIVLKTRRGTGR